MEISLSGKQEHTTNIVLGHTTVNNVTYYKYSENGAPPKITSDQIEIGQEALFRYWSDIGIFYHIDKPVPMTRMLSNFDLPPEKHEKELHNIIDTTSSAQPSQETQNREQRPKTNENTRFQLKLVINNPSNPLYQFIDNQTGHTVRVAENQLNNEQKRAVINFFGHVQMGKA